MPHKLDEISRVLGNIEGQLEGIQIEQGRQGKQLNTVSKKVHGLEIKSATSGGASGGVVALLVSVGFSMIGLPPPKG